MYLHSLSRVHAACGRSVSMSVHLIGAAVFTAPKLKSISLAEASEISVNCNYWKLVSIYLVQARLRVKPAQLTRHNFPRERKRIRSIHDAVDHKEALGLFIRVALLFIYGVVRRPSVLPLALFIRHHQRRFY